MSPITAKLDTWILLVDDEDIVLDVGAQMLERIGYKVFKAKNGKVAVDIFRENRELIRLVILDLKMPEMDGESAFRHLKQIQPEVKVLISSGGSLPDKVGDQLKHGCSGFIQKPFSLSNLSRKVDEVISH